MISNSQISDKRWHRLYKVVFFMVALILIVIGIALFEDSDGVSLWVALGIVVLTNTIYYEGILYIAYGAGGDSYLRKFLRLLGKMFGGGDSITSTSISSNQETESGAINPFLTSIYVGEEDPEYRQIVDGYYYYSKKGNEKSLELSNSLKDIIVKGGIDINALDESYSELEKQHYLQYLIAFLSYAYPEEVEKHNDNNLVQWLSKEGIELMESKSIGVNLKFLIIKINDSFKEIEGKVTDFLSNHIHGEWKAKLEDRSFGKEDGISKEEIIASTSELIDYLNASKDEYDIQEYVFDIMIYIRYFYSFVDTLDWGNLKKKLLLLSNIYDEMYLSFKWFEYYVRGHIASDLALVENYIKYDYDTKKKYKGDDLEKVKFVNPVYFNHVNNYQATLKDKKYPIENEVMKAL